MTTETDTPTPRCPTCNSPKPHLHPAMQLGGEVQPCLDPWHVSTPEGRRALDESVAALWLPKAYVSPAMVAVAPKLGRCANHNKADCPQCGAYLVIADQPSPVATARRPAWSIVTEYTAKRVGASAYGSTGVVDLVIADMAERDRVGRAEYGVPLTSGNGRDHLVDAYQEAMDLAVYLAAELDEHGIGPESYPYAAKFSDDVQRRLMFIQHMFHDAVTTIIRLRAIMEERR